MLKERENMKCSSGRAFGYQVLVALCFATLCTIIGFLPIPGQNWSDPREARYDAAPYESLGLGMLCVIVGLGNALLSSHGWTAFPVIVLAPTAYLLLLTLPTYFWFRHRQPSSLFWQVFMITSHIIFALTIVTRFLRN